MLLALLLPGCKRTPRQTQPVDSSTTEAPAPLLAPAAPAAPAPSGVSHMLAPGTVIPVELHSVLDSSVPSALFAVGVIPSDVKGADGKVALPAGSTVTMAVRDQGRTGPISAMTVSIYSINAFGQQYSFSDGRTEAARVTFREDAGLGSQHSAVHLQYGYPLSFKLERSVQLQ